MAVAETVETIFQHLPDQLKMQQRYRPNAQPDLNVSLRIFVMQTEECRDPVLVYQIGKRSNGEK
jgi:hypothetical protein